MAALTLSNIAIVLGKRLTVLGPYPCGEQRLKLALIAGSFASWRLVGRIDHGNEHIIRLITGQPFVCNHKLYLDRL